MIALKHIVVATDFGEAAEVALNYGRALARAFDAKLHLVHVVDDVAAQTGAMAGYGIDFVKLQQEVERAGRTQLDKLLSEEDRTQLGATPVVLTSTSPAHAVAEYAQKAGANLVIAGSHGKGPLAQMFVGSVAERLGRVAPCPVLLVHHPEREFVLPDALQRQTST